MKLLAAFFIIALFFVGAYIYSTSVLKKTTQPAITTPQPTTTSSTIDSKVSILAEGLDTPWAIAFLPTGGMLVTERPGRVRFIDANNQLQTEPVADIASVKEIGEGGLLGMTLHPDFATNNYVYLYYTYSSSGDNSLNRVVRMTLKNNQLVNEKIILDRIPGATNHNGGRIIFGSDGNLYIGTGDAGEPSQAQNTKSLAGKILRITDEGKPAAGNPFTNEVYSYGHRNVQGLAFDAKGQLWATEHGRSGVTTGMDEVNLIQSGKNYGWPDIEGDKTKAGMVTPKANSGATTTWAPAGAVFVGNSLFFGGLKGMGLYEAVIANDSVTETKEHFTNEYGRIREVITGPDGMLYFTTSNQDGRGKPDDTDDKVIRLNPQSLQ